MQDELHGHAYREDDPKTNVASERAAAGSIPRVFSDVVLERLDVRVDLLDGREQFHTCEIVAAFAFDLRPKFVRFLILVYLDLTSEPERRLVRFGLDRKRLLFLGVDLGV